MKCETKKETIRGYPFYFFFENLDNVQSYFIDKTDPFKEGFKLSDTWPN